ncbi:MAG: MarR family transcriptional regulator [Pseudomonadota bacterium]
MNPTEQITAGFLRIATLLRGDLWAAGEALGITETQARILGLLLTRSGLRVTALAELLGVRQPTASDAVATLERRGLLEKVRDPQDGRAFIVRLTGEGRAAAEQLRGVPAALEEALEELDEVERAALLRTLTGVIRRLQLTGAIPVQRLCVTCRHFRPNVHGDAQAPHHCDFVNAAFGDAQLRLDCGDHDPAGEPEAAAAWQRLSMVT